MRDEVESDEGEHILSERSELAQLWDESGDDEDWREAMEDLRTRLTLRTK